MEKTLKGYETRAGELRVRALRKGGERLMEAVDAQLGVVGRHIARVRDGDLDLTEGLEGEIVRCFRRCEELLA